jgi:RNA polymerase sigma-70 factor (ECF subfamily)
MRCQQYRLLEKHDNLRHLLAGRRGLSSASRQVGKQNTQQRAGRDIIVKWNVQSLFLRHARELTGALQRRGLSKETAADLTQDTFMRLITANPTGKQDNPRAYLFRISRNLAADHYRRECSVPIEDISEAEFAAVPDPRPSAETALYDKQRLALSEAALAELPERTRRAFELYRLEEMTIAEVAEKIGLSTTRTWALIRDAYRHVRARLHDK